MATPQETALIRIIARIDGQIAELEARILTSVSDSELHRIVEELANLHQSRWEREEALKLLRPAKAP